jgi:hypothetical protein
MWKELMQGACVSSAGSARQFAVGFQITFLHIADARNKEGMRNPSHIILNYSHGDDNEINSKTIKRLQMDLCLKQKI